MAAQIHKQLRVLAYSLPALLIACAIALVATANAGASATNRTATVAASAVDGSCDPFNDVDDPDCWDDTGDDEDTGDNGDGWGWGDDPAETAPTPGTGPTAPVKPPVWTPPTVKWPAPPKGAYAKLRANRRTAVAPKGAPKPVKAMIRAANSITRKPYKWGGGHGRWYDKGYDCSGSVSFVLRAGGYVNYPMVSGDLAKWGARGAGNWVRVYANKTHVFMVIAGLRFDTSSYGAGGGNGPRWRDAVRPTGGFALRHPVGL